MNLFYGGKFLKRSLVRGPLEAYIFMFWIWKAPLCLEALCGAFVLETSQFLDFLDMSRIKSMHFLKLRHFLKNGSPGQSTMLTRRATKFCVEPRSPFPYISHHDPKTLGKRLIIVSWPECRPEFPRDGGDGGGSGFPRTLDIWWSPVPTCPGTKYPVRGIPHFDENVSVEHQ